MKINSVKGTNDFLPKDSELRDYVQGKILETYKNHGFQRIYTPILEDIENLEKSDGGENLNLIYKILKRGDKFISAIENKQFDSLSDLGLRYDLTLPLTRFYSCHKQDLPEVFKCIQIDQVFRAERPQRGRDREFVQCDIDMLGSNSPNCEIELIDVTSEALLNIGLKNFVIRINDRRLLRQILLNFGFRQEELDSVCISFDKLDKIDAGGVKEELIAKGFNEQAIEKLNNFILEKNKTLQDIKKYVGESEVLNNLEYIISSVNKLAKGKYEIEFDVSLVRGQGYYTGAVFEIKSLDFGGSVGGGGRYDNLVGKFTGSSVPAVGFSIGFERIYSILKDKNFVVPKSKKKVAVIYDENTFVASFEFAKSLKNEFDTTLFSRPNKLGKFLGRIEEQNFDKYIVFYESKEIKDLKKN